MTARLLMVLLGLMAPGAPARQPCAETWDPAFGTRTFDGSMALRVRLFDLGDGLRPYVCGYIWKWTPTFDVEILGVARFNGREWKSLPGGIPDGYVHDIVAWDDGNGYALFVGGTTRSYGPIQARGIAKWDPFRGWQRVAGEGISGEIPTVTCMVVHDDGRGGGPELYVGGYFETMDGMVCNGIAKWNGQRWAPLGAGFSGSLPFPLSLYSYDADGPGPQAARLYAVGQFDRAGSGVGTDMRVAVWDGLQWTNWGRFTAGVRGVVAFDDDGDGPIAPAIYIGGSFERDYFGAVFNGMARRTGNSWTAVGPGPGVFTNFPNPGTVHGITLYPLGSGVTLCATGPFLRAPPAESPYIALWNGETWLPFPGGNPDYTTHTTTYDPRPSRFGSGLFLAGVFDNVAGVPSHLVARYGCRACPGDYNADGQVDFFDYLDFIADFAAEHPRADWDGNGQVDFFDYLDFIIAFGEEC